MIFFNVEDITLLFMGFAKCQIKLNHVIFLTARILTTKKTVIIYKKAVISNHIKQICYKLL